MAGTKSGALTIVEVEASARGAAFRAIQCFLEPRMIVTAVIGHDIDDDLYSNVLECLHHLVEILQCPDVWIDIAIVGDVVWIVDQRGDKMLRS